MSITKKELTDLIYDKMGISQNECYELVKRFFDIIKDELIRGDDVMISGFGRWSVKKKRARNGRNPQTGRSITIGARKVVTFRSSEMLRSKMNSIY
jgi:integration host factor subunit alpha